jgi:uncharacterized protein (TIGR00725 family)
MTERRLYIAVCGGGRCTEEEAAWAEEIGRLLAQRNAVVVCGGLGGVMDAVARGSAAEGGTSIGILPGRDRSEAAPDITYALTTGMGEARNVLVVSAADAVIAVGGEYGTLSEVAFALRIGIPVVGLHTWELSRPGAEPDAALIRARTPREAFDLAVSQAEGRGTRQG